jgi:hypothetical protein
MPSEIESGTPARSIDLGVAVLVISIALFYFLFQLIFIFVATVGLDGECLYTFWLSGEAWWRSPYWLVVTIVATFVVMSLFAIADGVRSAGTTKTVFGIVAIIVLGLWLYSLNGLWEAMLFEKGEISSEDWYQGRPLMLIGGSEHVCEPGI